MSIIDAHAHVFDCIDGKNRFGNVLSSRFGKVKVAGLEKPFMPAICEKTSFRIEMLLELMEQNNVERAVLVQNPTIGICNEYIADATNRFPQKFIGTMQVVLADPEATQKIRSLYESGFFRALKLEMSQDWGWGGLYPNIGYNSPEIMRIVEQAAEYGLVLILDTGPVGNSGYDVPAIEELILHYPQARFLIEHLGSPTLESETDPAMKETWKRLITLAKKPNVYLGFSCVPTLLTDEYPCKRSLQLLHEAVCLVGAEKILWGSDIPSTLRSYTYRQMIDTILEHADFLSQNDKENIMGQTANRLFS